MKAFSVGAVTRAGLVVVLFVSLVPAIPETPTVRIVKAANNFLASLDAKQRQRVLYAFDDNEQRRR